MSSATSISERPRQRAAQKAATRERIVDGLVAELTAGERDLSIERLARRVGVSPRTIYVHFRDREELLAALDERVNRQLLVQPEYGDPDGLVAGTAAEFRDASENAELLLAQLRTGLGRELRERSRLERAERVQEALEPLLDGLTADERREALAVILLLRGADAWRALHEDHGLDSEGCARSVAWAMSALIADLRRRSGEEPSA